MNNKDIIQRFLFENINVRGEIVRLNQSMQTILEQHNYSKVIKKILSEALVVASLLSATIKFKGRLTVQFQGSQPLKLMLAQCTHHFELRGLVQCDQSLTEDEVILALKQGTLAIIINPDATTTPYQGIVSWRGHSFAESVEGYFIHSEQLPTRFWIAVNETSAVGLMLQVIPDKNRDERDWEHIIHLTNTITPEELLSLENEAVLYRLYSEENIRVFSAIPVTFGCECSIERCENAILLLGEEEAKQELSTKQNIVVTCEFCNKEYSFDRVDVARIFKKGDPSSIQVH